MIGKQRYQVYGNMKEQLAGIEKQSEGRSEEIVSLIFFCRYIEQREEQLVEN
jgi:hypothetical protein